jgi:transposase
VGQLLTTIGGIGETTAATLIAELGDPARFAGAAALTAYVGLCPGHKHSGSINRKALRSARSSAIDPCLEDLSMKRVIKQEGTLG